MSEKQLTAQNLSAESLVKLRCDMQHLENEVSRFRGELDRQQAALDRFKAEYEEARQAQAKVDRIRYLVTILVAIAAVVVPIILK